MADCKTSGLLYGRPKGTRMIAVLSVNVTVFNKTLKNSEEEEGGGEEERLVDSM